MSCDGWDWDETMGSGKGFAALLGILMLLAFGATGFVALLNAFWAG